MCPAEDVRYWFRVGVLQNWFREDNISGTCTGIKRKVALRQQLFSVFLQSEGSPFLQGMLVFNACVSNTFETAPKSWHCLPLGICVCFSYIAFHGPSLSPNVCSETSWQSCLNSAILPGKYCLLAWIDLGFYSARNTSYFLSWVAFLAF